MSCERRESRHTPIGCLRGPTPLWLDAEQLKKRLMLGFRWAVGPSPGRLPGGRIQLDRLGPPPPPDTCLPPSPDRLCTLLPWSLQMA